MRSANSAPTREGSGCAPDQDGLPRRRLAGGRLTPRVNGDPGGGKGWTISGKPKDSVVGAGVAADLAVARASDDG